jgi:hypothetical protein
MLKHIQNSFFSFGGCKNSVEEVQWRQNARIGANSVCAHLAVLPIRRGHGVVVEREEGEAPRVRQAEMRTPAGKRKQPLSVIERSRSCERERRRNKFSVFCARQKKTNNVQTKSPVVFEKNLLVLRVLLRERPRAAHGDQQLVSPESAADLIPVLKGDLGRVGGVEVAVADVYDGVGSLPVAEALPGVDAMRIHRVGRDVAYKHLLELPRTAGAPARRCVPNTK